MSAVFSGSAAAARLPVGQLYVDLVADYRRRTRSSSPGNILEPSFHAALLLSSMMSQTSRSSFSSNHLTLR